MHVQNFKIITYRGRASQILLALLNSLAAAPRGDRGRLWQPIPGHCSWEPIKSAAREPMGTLLVTGTKIAVKNSPKFPRNYGEFYPKFRETFYGEKNSPKFPRNIPKTMGNFTQNFGKLLMVRKIRQNFPVILGNLFQKFRETINDERFAGISLKF